MVEARVYRICLGFGVKSSIAHGLRAQGLLCTLVLMEYQMAVTKRTLGM